MPSWLKLVLGLIAAGFMSSTAVDVYHLNGNFNHDFYVCTH